MLALILVMVEQVSPVVVPLLATLIPNWAAARVAEGGAGEMLVGSAGPRARMVLAVSTAPGTISARAASTLLGAMPLLKMVGTMVDCSCRLATTLGALKQAGDPGWLIASPGTPKLDLARMWLLLKRYNCPPRLTRPPVLRRTSHLKVSGG